MQRNFSTPISIPSIAVGTLSGESYRWLAANDRNHVQDVYFAAARDDSPLGLLKYPKQIRKRPKDQLPRLGQWVFALRDVTESPSAWVEAHHFPGGFATCHLYVGGTFHQDLPDAVAQLVTALFIGGDCDIIDIWCVEPLTFESLQLHSEGSVSDAFTISAEGDERRCSRKLQLSSQDWQKRPDYGRHEKSLSYLVRRHQRLSKPKAKQGQRYLSLISRIFRPWS